VIRYLNIANVMTTGSLVLGFSAVMLAGEGRTVLAAALIAVAAVLDVLDGLVARSRSITGRFGANLDSLADMVSFGAAPAMLLYHGPLASLPAAVTGAVCIAFVVAGGWRLARFPLVEDTRRWVGVPIPAAGLGAASCAVLALPAAATAALALVLGWLMISEVSLPTALTARDAVLGRNRHREGERRRRHVPARLRRRRRPAPASGEDDAEAALALARR
jgi:CDP-diacylglycerol--serine O-phosphatidyltransferase